MTKLEYMAARISFDKVTAAEIQSTIDTLLNQGVYFDEFIDIINSVPARLDEVLPPFTTFLRGEGVSIPTKEQAVWLLIAHHLTHIADGTAEPIEELKRLIADVYWDYDFHTVTKQYLGDSHGIEHLIGLYWQYDDLVEARCDTPEETQRLREQILKRSKEWLERFGTKAFKVK